MSDIPADTAPGATAEDARPISSKADLAAAVGELLRAAEQKTGHSIGRQRLGRELGISTRSLYAYLAGQTLMSDGVLERLLGVLGVSPAERTRLRQARDRLQGIRRAEAGGGPAVHGLPPKVTAFTGRVEQLAKLDRLRASRKEHQRW